MDAKSALEAIEAIRSTVPQEEFAELKSGVADQFNLVAETAGPLAVEASAAEAVSPVDLRESLSAGVETALTTYGSFVDTVNAARAEVKGRKKPGLLEAVDTDTIRSDVEALLDDEAVIADLQAEIDYFTAHPEVDSPAAGFDLVIVPEGLTAADDQAIARDLQGRIQAQLGTDYDKPYIRPAAYNDDRTPEVTGKGYRIVFAPRHYNVPKGTATAQTNWINGNNHRTAATELQTATDTEAMAQINNLLENDVLPKGAGYDVNRFHQTYFRRSDQAPHGGRVSCVFVDGDGRLNLGGSHVRFDGPTRALVVPKA